MGDARANADSHAQPRLQGGGGAREPVLDRRRSGVLLHLASLGPGALGAPAHAFVDWLAAAGFSVWQMLPVGPRGADGSPYWVGSDCAGDPALIDLAALPDAGAAAGERQRWLEAQRDWLPDYALFVALREEQGGAAWVEWPVALRDREPAALAAARARLAARIAALCDEQHAFHVQWQALRRHAHARGVRLFGDLPIYVAPDSAETWAQRAQFRLGADGRPTAVAGVPPDYFSAEGQLWGNPLYDWERMRADGFAHWRRRLRHQLERFDLTRLDHFRGLAAHWAVPAAARSAREGEWQATPGLELLDALARDAPDLPLVAEDLGVITPDVEALRREFALPGMHVLQFGFDGAGDNPHLPQMHRERSVVYTGTHDNDTLRGWLATLDAPTLRRVECYCGVDAPRLHAALLRAALASVGRLAILPAQDLLDLGSEARLNTPGTVIGNWSWQLPLSLLGDDLARHYALLNRIHGRR